MTIRFRYFPYLVQQKVMHHMDFIDVFSLYAISKKSQALAKSYFNRLDCSLTYDKDKEISIRRKISSGNFCWTSDRLKIKPTMRQQKRVFIICTSRYSKQLQIPANTSGNMCDGVLRFAGELFPKIVFNFDFHAPTLKDFQRIMNLTKILNVPVKTVDIHHYKINDSFMRTILTECSDVKILKFIGSYPHFQYDLQANPPFRFDFFYLRNAEWVTRDHLVNLFMGCKKVYLSAPSGIHYNDQELVEICEKWLEAPETQYLEISKSETFSEDIGEIPGALEVRELLLANKHLPFYRKECYKLKKADGTPAVIYHNEDNIVLRTDFEYAAVGEDDDFPEELLKRLGWARQID